VQQRPRTRASLASLNAPALDRLFAYGTLMTGFSRRPLLGPTALLEGPGRIQGSLYDFGEYPGVVLDGAGRVSGELYRIPDLDALLPALDREEWYDPLDADRSLYVRRPVPVELDDAAVREAWVYVYNGPPGRGPRILSGDWRGHRAARGSAAR
jgi:gamma-glutamylcyclotransferase (GGCT)/AIG2-like uncharacterized protein YtfP